MGGGKGAQAGVMMSKGVEGLMSSRDGRRGAVSFAAVQQH